LLSRPGRVTDQAVGIDYASRHSTTAPPSAVLARFADENEVVVQPDVLMDVVDIGGFPHFSAEPHVKATLQGIWLTSMPSWRSPSKAGERCHASRYTNALNCRRPGERHNAAGRWGDRPANQLPLS
jgi:hypothetical protein